MKHTQTNSEKNTKPSNSNIPRRSKEWWQRHVDAWRVSDLSKAAYCREHGLQSSSFYQWCQRTENDEIVSQVNPRFADHFIPATITGSLPQTLNLVVGDITLQCPVNVSEEQLTQWIRAVRSASCSI